MVSVPTRGLLIPNESKTEVRNNEKIVSVPTRGLLIPNRTGLVTFDYTDEKFPSPQGVS